MEWRGRGWVQTGGLGDFEDRSPEGNCCMLDGAGNLLPVQVNFFRFEGLLQKIDQPVGAHGVQERIDSPQALGNMAGAAARWDGTNGSAWSLYPPAAFSPLCFAHAVASSPPPCARP